MLKLILVDLKRNKNNSFKLVFLLFIIITIISFYFASINSLNNTVKCEEKKLIYDNYYQVIDDDFNADIILKNIEYEKKEYSYREDNFRIEFVNSNYSMFVRENIKILNLKDKDYLMPKIVKSSYEANNINELYIGFLPNNINEVCIPYSYYINISPIQIDNDTFFINIMAMRSKLPGFRYSDLMMVVNSMILI